MTQQIRRIWADESSQDLAKSALLLVLLTLVVMGPVIATFFNNVSNHLNTNVSNNLNTI